LTRRPGVCGALSSLAGLHADCACVATGQSTSCKRVREPQRIRADVNIVPQVRVTEAAALAAAHWLGKGQKDAADGAAVDAMRTVLGSISFDGVVVIGP